MVPHSQRDKDAAAELGPEKLGMIGRNEAEESSALVAESSSNSSFR